MIAAGLGAAVSEPVTVKVASDGSRVELLAASPEADPRLLVRPVDGPPLLGRVESRPDRLVFRPALPFLPGRRYLAEWREGSSGLRQAEFRWDSPKRRPPQVELRPQGSLPANALKLYLHFSAPMEQGVFLDRLRLLDAAGHEITGPFRETELWSPDGKRLTLWFHPGRQKTGVNLNLDEGPVLPEGQTGTLVVSGHWRDTAGAALGHDVRLKWEVISADHSPPAMEWWTILPPPAGSSEALSVRFDEPLDPMTPTEIEAEIKAWRGDQRHASGT
jgi:hypothetical protein